MESNTTLSTSSLTVIAAGKHPAFRLFPCKPTHVRNKQKLLRRSLAPPGGGGGGGGGPSHGTDGGPGSPSQIDDGFDPDAAKSDFKNDDADNDIDRCDGDDRLANIRFVRLQEVDERPRVFAGHLGLNLQAQPFTVDSSVADKIVLSGSFDSQAFRANRMCRTALTNFNGTTSVTITGVVTRAGTAVGDVGTLTTDSFKWSVQVDNWPYCEGTSLLDLIVQVQTRGGPRRAELEGDREFGGGKPGDRPFRPISKDHAPRDSITLPGNTTKIVFPTFATLDSNVQVAINVTNQVVGRGAGALTHYKIPAYYLDESGNKVYASKIFYDPAYSVGEADISSVPSSGLAPAAIGGIVAGIVVVLLIFVGIIMRKKISARV